MRFNAMGFPIYAASQSRKNGSCDFYLFEGGQQKSYLVIHFYKANLSRRIEKKALFVDAFTSRVQGKALYSSVKCMSKPK